MFCFTSRTFGEPCASPCGALQSGSPCSVQRTIAGPFSYTARMPPRPELSFADSLQSERRKEFYETHRSIAIAMILIVFLAPFAGLFVRGLAGIVGGVVISAIGYYLTPYIVLKLQA